MLLYNCPRCGSMVINTGTDTGGQHWRCLSCGLTDTNITYIFSSSFGGAWDLDELRKENSQLRGENEALKRIIVDLREQLETPKTRTISGSLTIDSYE